MIYMLLFIVFVSFLFNEFYWKRRNLPPGPVPLPLIGNFHTINKFEPGYAAYDMWKKQFGPVFTVWFGPIPAVVIADYDAIKRVMVLDGDNYADRFRICSPDLTDIFRGGDFGVIETSGTLWREQRRFTLHVFRDFGLGRNVMEAKVMSEVDQLLSRLSLAERSSLDIIYHIDVSVGSVINNLLLGYGFDTEARLREFHELKPMLVDTMHDAGRPDYHLLTMFPILRNLPLPFSKNFMKKVTARGLKLYGFFEKQINAHKNKIWKTFNYRVHFPAEIDYSDENSSDYVEAFLKQQRKDEMEGRKSDFHELQLKNICLDLWIAGMETSSNTLAWSVVYLLRNPSCQSRLQSELDSVLPGASRVSMADRPRLPYACAVVNEVQRLANLLPTNLMRRAARDVVIEGHAVAEGTCVIPQISAVMYDDKIFPDPHSFKPDRFIGPDGSLLKVEQLIPFSMGKRACLGESLARMELFLFLTNLFLTYEVLPDGVVPSDKKFFGVTVQPQPFKCAIRRRY